MISFVKPRSTSFLPRHDFGGELGERDADGLADEGDGARGARIDLEDVDDFVLHGELDVHEAADVEGLGHLEGGVADFGFYFFGERGRGDDAGAVAAVDAGLLDVLHDGADDGGVAVGDAVDIDFGGVVEEAVDEHGALGRGGNGVAHVVAEFVVGVDDLHGAAAEDEAGADENGIADLGGGGDGFVLIGGDAVGRLVEAELVQHLLEEFAVLGALDGLDTGADDGDAVFLEAGGEVEGSLAAELDDDAVRFFAMADVEDVFQREGLEE